MALTPREELYCTGLDVMQMILDISVERINFSQLQNIVVRSFNHLEYYIALADAQINMYLAEAYPNIALSSWRTTPWATAPITPIDPASGALKNSGTGILLSVAPLTTTKTSAWLLSADNSGDEDDAKYSAYSFLYGPQGTGKLFNTDETIGTYVTVEADAWSDGSTTQAGFLVATDDQWLFSINTSYKGVWLLSLTLATAFALNSIYLGQSSTDSPYGSMFFNRAMGLLKDLRDKKISLGIGLSELDIIPPTEIQYYIDNFGNDATRYMQSQYNSYRSS